MPKHAQSQRLNKNVVSSH